MRIVNELPPSYHECIRTFAMKSQQNWKTLFELQRQRKYDTSVKNPSATPNENDRWNNNNNNESTSSTTNDVNAGNFATVATSDANGNFILVNDNGNDTLDMINVGKGVIKLDMSRIIDPTGLPTYEAALKLKSSSYI
jgi:hypothetical protein